MELNVYFFGDLTSSNLGFSMNKFFQLCNLMYRQTQVIRKFFSGLNLSGTISLILTFPFGATNCKTFGGLLPLFPTSVLPFPILIPWSLHFFKKNHHPCCPWGCCTQKWTGSCGNGWTLTKFQVLDSAANEFSGRLSFCGILLCWLTVTLQSVRTYSYELFWS